MKGPSFVSMLDRGKWYAVSDQRTLLSTQSSDVRVVVDLWGYKVDTSAIGHRTYTADTLTNVFSSTKVRDDDILILAETVFMHYRASLPSASPCWLREDC